MADTFTTRLDTVANSSQSAENAWRRESKECTNYLLEYWGRFSYNMFSVKNGVLQTCTLKPSYNHSHGEKALNDSKIIICISIPEAMLQLMLWSEATVVAYKEKCSECIKLHKVPPVYSFIAGFNANIFSNKSAKPYIQKSLPHMPRCMGIRICRSR